MSVELNLGNILNELVTSSSKIEEQQVQQLVKAIGESSNIFLVGKGRSGVAIQGFANRLMHLGLSAHMIGEISTPHSKAGDLLIIGSGSGETEALIAIASKAKKSGVKIALITMSENSTLGKMADTLVILTGASPKLKDDSKAVKSIQPMGSLFEQLSFLTYDAVILELMKVLNQNSDEMFQRHADLE